LPYRTQTKPQIYRSIFLSDFHIGAKNFNAAALLDFLRKTESQTLYLVGDIVDGWKLHKRWYWTETINEIFDELFRKAHEGTTIVYITGNHDEAVRDLSLIKRLRYARRMNIQIRNRAIHKCADGRDFLVMHGDQFDRALLRGTVSRMTDRLYDFITDRLQKRRPINITVEGSIKRFSLSKFLSYHGQVALNILNNYERALAREARRSDVEGIICGHTHIPAFKNIGPIIYANCGSWLKDGRTAIVETMSGHVKLLDWPRQEAQENMPLLPFYQGDMVKIIPDAARFRPMTDRLVASIRRTWPSPHDASTKINTDETIYAKICLQ
jgi:UDP-2,3-diacylglucosamine pyrophosphatase LpxH